MDTSREETKAQTVRELLGAHPNDHACTYAELSIDLLKSIFTFDNKGAMV